LTNPATFAIEAPTPSPGPAHVVCPICATSDSRAYVTLATIRRTADPAGPYRILRCRAHGVEFADADSGIAGGAATQSDLDSIHGALDDARQSRYVGFVDSIERLLGHPGALHDVGCGNGQLLIEAKRRGWTVQGNDLLTSVGEALATRGIPYLVGELSQLDLPSSSLDVVSSFCVLLPHVPDPLPDLRTAARILRPGGWLIAELPDDGLYRRVAKLLYWLSRGRWEAPLANIYSPSGHLFGYSQRTAALLLEQCGFQRVLIEPYRQPAGLSAARFSNRGVLFRTLAKTGIGALAMAARILRMPNHMIVFAQTPSRISPDAAAPIPKRPTETADGRLDPAEPPTSRVHALNLGAAVLS
jgi:SAM-dependent methyltransferase